MNFNKRNVHSFCNIDCRSHRLTICLFLYFKLANQNIQSTHVYVKTTKKKKQTRRGTSIDSCELIRQKRTPYGVYSRWSPGYIPNDAIHCVSSIQNQNEKDNLKAGWAFSFARKWSQQKSWANDLRLFHVHTWIIDWRL